jgi:hypothetical protein
MRVTPDHRDYAALMGTAAAASALPPPQGHAPQQPTRHPAQPARVRPRAAGRPSWAQ